MHHGGEGDRHSPGTHTEVSEGKVPNKLVAPIVERSVPKQCSQYQSITCSNWGGSKSSNWGGSTSSKLDILQVNRTLSSHIKYLF